MHSSGNSSPGQDSSTPWEVIMTAANKTRLLAFAGTTLALLTLSAPAHAKRPVPSCPVLAMTSIRAAAPRPARRSLARSRKPSSTVRWKCLDPSGYSSSDDHWKSMPRLYRNFRIDPWRAAPPGITISIAIGANGPFRTVRIHDHQHQWHRGVRHDRYANRHQGHQHHNAAVVEIEDTGDLGFLAAGYQ